MDDQLRAQLVNAIAEAIAESGHGRSHTLEWCNGLAEAVLAALLEHAEHVGWWDKTIGRRLQKDRGREEDGSPCPRCVPVFRFVFPQEEK